jgi:hypothetical protein
MYIVVYTLMIDLIARIVSNRFCVRITKGEQKYGRLLTKKLL